MDSKTITILALVAISAVIVAGVALIIMDDGEDNAPSDSVTYHGNGGMFDGKDSFVAADSTLSPCAFEKEGYTFYSWNTKADASGTFYDPNDPEDASLFASSGVKDLYAVWVFTQTGFFATNTVGDVKLPSLVMVSSGSFLDPQAVGPLPTYLDPNTGTARLGLVSQYKTDVWSVSADMRTFTVDSADHHIKVVISQLSGATDLSVTESKDGMVAVDFKFTGNVTMSFTITTNPSSHEVTYHANGGVDKLGKDTHTTPSKAILRADYFTYDGYSFVRWTVNPDGTGASFVPGDEDDAAALNASDIKDLYAQWLPS